MFRFLAICCLAALAGPAFPAGFAFQDRFPDLRHQGFIVVTPNGPKDGGDFGKRTPGTRTAGIQEALNCLKSINTGQHRFKNLFIANGTYVTSDTIKIPWMGERLLVQADQTMIYYTGLEGDALDIDSQMNSRMTFGYIAPLNSRKGWAVRIKPEDPSVTRHLPKERQSAVFTCSEILFNGIVAKGWYIPGEVDQRSNGLLLDGSAGPIVWNKFAVSEMNTCDVGVELRGGCHANAIDIADGHGNNTHLLVGEAASQNTIDMSINSDNVPGSIGARIFGRNNTLHLSLFQTAMDKNIVFEAPAHENIVYANDLPNGIANHAAVSTNRIVSQSLYKLKTGTPAVPAPGAGLVNPYPYNIEITIVAPGKVSRWAVADARKAPLYEIAAPLTAGQQLRLQPGESIQLNYTEPPAWKWQGVQE